MIRRRGVDRLPIRLVLLVALMLLTLLPMAWPTAHAVTSPVEGFRSQPAAAVVLITQD
jgi:hypothetical protein